MRTPITYPELEGLEHVSGGIGLLGAAALVGAAVSPLVSPTPLVGPYAADYYPDPYGAYGPYDYGVPVGNAYMVGGNYAYDAAYPVGLNGVVVGPYDDYYG